MLCDCFETGRIAAAVHLQYQVAMDEVKKYIFNVYSFHHHRRCWPTSIQNLPVNRAVRVFTDTHDVGLSTQFRFNVGPVSQPIAGSMPTNKKLLSRRWPNITAKLGLLYT